jgi:hypothetical protein
MTDRQADYESVVDFTITAIVRNCWTVKQADNDLLSRWSERPETDRLLIAQRGQLTKRQIKHAKVPSAPDQHC